MFSLHYVAHSREDHVLPGWMKVFMLFYTGLILSFIQGWSYLLYCADLIYYIGLILSIIQGWSYQLYRADLIYYTGLILSIIQGWSYLWPLPWSSDPLSSHQSEKDNMYTRFVHRCVWLKNTSRVWKELKQAGAELGQAQLKLRLDF